MSILVCSLHLHQPHGITAVSQFLCDHFCMPNAMVGSHFQSLHEFCIVLINLYTIQGVFLSISCYMKWCPSLFVHCICISPMGQQKFSSFSVTFLACQMQWLLPSSVTASIYALCLNNISHNSRGYMKWCPSLFVHCICISPMEQQHFPNFPVIVYACPMQWLSPIFSHCIILAL